MSNTKQEVREKLFGIANRHIPTMNYPSGMLQDIEQLINSEVTKVLNRLKENLSSYTAAHDEAMKLEAINLIDEELKNYE